jgi:hypothetical protein
MIFSLKLEADEAFDLTLETLLKEGERDLVSV